MPAKKKSRPRPLTFMQKEALLFAWRENDGVLDCADNDPVALALVRKKLAYHSAAEGRVRKSGNGGSYCITLAGATVAEQTHEDSHGRS